MEAFASVIWRSHIQLCLCVAREWVVWAVDCEIASKGSVRIMSHICNMHACIKMRRMNENIDISTIKPLEFISISESSCGTSSPKRLDAAANEPTKEGKYIILFLANKRKWSLRRG